MPIFSYKSINNKGEEISGVIESDTENSAISSIIQKELTPISIEVINEKKDEIMRSIRSSPSKEDILFFVRNFGVALKSGVTVISALDIMEKDASKPSMKEMLARIGASVRSGLPLSDSFVPFEKYFSPAFIGLLRAGEANGTVGSSFLLIGEYLSREFSLNQKLKSAMIYPLILIVSSALVVMLLMIFVLPQLSGAFAQSGVSLPLITRIVLFVSHIFTYSLWLDFFIILILVGIVFWFKNSSIGREKYSRFLEKAPIANKMMLAIATVRFLRTLGNLVKSGVPIILALDTTATSLGHFGMSESIAEIQKYIEGGGRLSDGMEKYPRHFSAVIIGLTRVGEETGKLGDVLIEVSEFYDDELNNNLKNAMALLEPLLLLFMGIIVGAIALSVLLPIYQLVSKLA